MGACAWIALALTACDVEWGGAEFRLENPAPEPEPEVVAGEEAEVPPTPLPDGPLLYMVRSGVDGVSRAAPVARMTDAGLAPLPVPAEPDETWSDRFRSEFMPPGRELPLHAAGRRIGSLVLDGAVEETVEGCFPVATGRVLVPAGSSVPARAFAFAAGAQGGDPAPEPYEAHAVDNRMRTFGPILAEQLMRSRGENRPYLAQRADMQAVAWPGDRTPAFAATYLINDALDAPAPDGEAVSLFFLARFDAQRGYVPVWSEFRRYDGGAGKEVFTYLDAIDAPPGRIDFVHTRDGSSAIWIAGSPDGEGQRRIDWTEGTECRSELLLGPAVEEAGATAPS